MTWPLLAPPTTVSVASRCPGPYPMLTALLPRWPLFFLPLARQAPVSSLCIRIPLGWSLAAVLLPPTFRAGFLPSLIQKSLVLSNIPSKHTASRHSSSSHLPFFPSWHLLADTFTYLFVDLFECPSPPQYISSSSVSAPLHVHSPGSAHHTEDTRK